MPRYLDPAVNAMIGIIWMEPVDCRSSPDAKIALFRSLFRGRDDVYPRRFESRRTGKSGYAPACGNEWIHGICEKPRIKRSEEHTSELQSLRHLVCRLL